MGALKDALLEAEETRQEEFQEALANFDYYKLASLTWEAHNAYEAKKGDEQCQAHC